MNFKGGMAQREKNSLSLELTVDSICNILSTIFQLSFMGLIKFAAPASAILGVGYCHVSNVIMSLEMFRFLSTTFTITVYRYIFIIHSEKINRSEKLKKYIKWTIFSIKWLLLLTNMLPSVNILYYVGALMDRSVLHYLLEIGPVNHFHCVVIPFMLFL